MMGSPLYSTRFAFDADESSSTELDLSAFRVRGIFSPEGHALGRIDITTRRDLASGAALLGGTGLVDSDEVATLLRVKDDLPLMWTTLDVEHPRDEAFELFLVYEHRG